MRQLQLISPLTLPSCSTVFCFLFLSLASSKHFLSFRFLLFLLRSPPIRQTRLDDKNLLTNTRSGLLGWLIDLSACKSEMIFLVWLSSSYSGFHTYHFAVWVNISLLHNSQWSTFPIQSCILGCLYSTSLLHSLTMRSTISSESLHHLHLFFCCIQGAETKFGIF